MVGEDRRHGQTPRGNREAVSPADAIKYWYGMTKIGRDFTEL